MNGTRGRPKKVAHESTFNCTSSPFFILGKRQTDADLPHCESAIGFTSPEHRQRTFSFATGSMMGAKTLGYFFRQTWRRDMFSSRERRSLTYTVCMRPACVVPPCSLPLTTPPGTSPPARRRRKSAPSCFYFCSLCCQISSSRLGASSLP